MKTAFLNEVKTSAFKIERAKLENIDEHLHMP